MVCESLECSLQAKFPVQSPASFCTIDSLLISKLMEHDAPTETVGGTIQGQQDDFNLPENLEAQ